MAARKSIAAFLSKFARIFKLEVVKLETVVLPSFERVDGIDREERGNGILSKKMMNMVKKSSAS